MSNKKRLISALLLSAILIMTTAGGLAEDTVSSTPSSSAPADNTTQSSETQGSTAGNDTNTDASSSSSSSTSSSTTSSTTSSSTTTTTTTTAVKVVTAKVRLSSNSDRLPLFPTKQISNAELGLFANGTVVTVLERASDWCYVQIGSLKGYMQTPFLNFGAEPTATPQAAYYAYVSTGDTDPLVLFEGADLNSKQLGAYYTGTRVYVTAADNTWSKVEISGVKGYMLTRFLVRSVTPTQAPSSSTYAIVNNPNPRDRLNLRASASTGSTSLGRFYNGTQVKVLEYGTPWCRVDVNGTIGYMMTSYLSFPATPTATPSALPTYIPTPTSGTVIYATVNNANPRDRLNLRMQPNLDSSVLGRFYNGTQVKVTQLDTIWCRVEVNGLQGYMMTQYLAFGNNNNNNNNNTGTYVNAVVSNPVATQRLNLRSGPSTGTASIGQYYNGTQVKVYDRGSDWSQVEVNGKAGYMMTRYLSFNGSGTTTNPTVGVVKNPVATQRLNLRAYPSTGSLSLAQYFNGTRVKILSYGKDWCQVEVDGMKGYMMTRYMDLM